LPHHEHQPQPAATRSTNTEMQQIARNGLGKGADS
jgi:hypothetical protein